MRELIIALNLMFLTMVCFPQEKGTFLDSRDGKIYKTVKIGGQTWLAENLAFRPVDGVVHILNDDTANIKQFGYLYDWETAVRMAPAGWHLPTNMEIDTLIKYINRVYNPNPFDALVKGGSSGFDALFGGSRIVGEYGPRGYVVNNGVFKNDGLVQFWTSKKTMILADAFFCQIFGLSEKDKRIFTGNSYYKSGHYIRLIKD